MYPKKQKNELKTAMREAKDRRYFERYQAVFLYLDGYGVTEIGRIIGEQHKADPVLLTLVERQTRFEVLVKIDNKDAESVSEAIEDLSNRIGIEMPALFKSITADNGSEFSELYEQLNGVTDVYFVAHPYASYERGTSENQHRLIRRFIPKNTAMKYISDQQVQRI